MLATSRICCSGSSVLPSMASSSSRRYATVSASATRGLLRHSNKQHITGQVPRCRLGASLRSTQHTAHALGRGSCYGTAVSGTVVGGIPLECARQRAVHGVVEIKVHGWQTCGATPSFTTLVAGAFRRLCHSSGWWRRPRCSTVSSRAKRNIHDYFATMCPHHPSGGANTVRASAMLPAMW